MVRWIPGEPPDPVRTVREGYDRIGPRYLEWTRTGVGADPKGVFLARVLDEVRPGATVLDLGCGPGEPVLRRLAGRFRAIGLDLSREQLRIAAHRCPAVPLVQADVGRPLFRPASFDAIVSLFVLLHLPAAAHPAVYERMASWLRPGGRCYVSTGTGGDVGGIEESWLGVPMYFGGPDADTTSRLVVRAGLEVESVEVIEQEEDGQALPFLWLVARRPSARRPSGGAPRGAVRPSAPERPLG